MSDNESPYEFGSTDPLSAADHEVAAFAQHHYNPDALSDSNEGSNSETSGAVEVPAVSSYVRVRSERRKKRRRLAAILSGLFFVIWMTYGATAYRTSFEHKLERNVRKAISGPEFSNIQVVADGRNIRLQGSVANEEEAQRLIDQTKGVRYVRSIDRKKLTIGARAGTLLPLSAVYTEGKLSFSGTRPSDAALAALVKAAKTGLGNDSVSTEFKAETGTLGDVASYDALGAVFGRFPSLKVRSATVEITAEETVVAGKLGGEDGRDELISSLTTATSRPVIDHMVAEPLDAPTTLVGGTDTTVTSAAGTQTSNVEPTSLSATTLSTEDKQILQDEVSATLKQNRIEFATDSAVLTDKAKATINDLASRLKESGVAFEVGGHTDSRGRAERNLALSQNRADAVRAAFIQAGIPADKVTAKGYGSAKTIAPDNTSKGNPLNRRIEITLQ